MISTLLEKTDQLALAAQIKHNYLWQSAVSEEEGMLCSDVPFAMGVTQYSTYTPVRLYCNRPGDQKFKMIIVEQSCMNCTWHACV